MEERLWNYIDGVSEAGEKSAIETLLQSNIEWQSKYKELLDVHGLLKQSELEEPSMRFTMNVMEEIARLQITPATRSYLNNKIIYGIGVFFVTMMAGFLVYGFAQVDWTAGSQTNIPVDLTKVNFNVFFNNTYVNIFMMINVMLGLVLLDRYLAAKKRSSATLRT